MNTGLQKKRYFQDLNIIYDHMNKKNTFFSILIPSYNRPEELRRNISSILENTFVDYEIVISDDNSPKKNEINKVISSFEGESRIRFYSQSKNLKEPGNKNFLIQVAKGQFNIILGDDDTLVNNALSKIHLFITKNPGYDIYGLGYKIVDENNFNLSIHKAPKKINLNNTKLKKLLLEAGTLPMTIFHPATFCCKNGIERSMPYRNDVGIGEDMFFIFEAVLSDTSLIVIPEALFNWRKVQDIRSVQQGNQSAEHLASFKSKTMIYKKLMSKNIKNKEIEVYIHSLLYRTKLMYVEVLRDKNLAFIKSNKEYELKMIEEIERVNSSIFWILRIKFIRFERLFELIYLFGFFSTLFMMFQFFGIKFKSFIHLFIGHKKFDV